MNVELYLNGYIFTGFKSVNVLRSLESMSGHFELGLAARLQDDVSLIKAGSKIELKANEQTLITGYIDSVQVTINATEKTITISGRDKTADLIDCAVLHHSYQFNGQTLEQIAVELCKPFGVSVKWEVQDNTANAVVDVWQVEPGETVFETLSKAARYRGVLMTSNPQGDLVFTEPSKALSSTNLELGKNLLSIDLNDSWENRFSIYRVIGDNQAGGQKGDEVNFD